MTLECPTLGFRRMSLTRLAENARETMGGLFTADPKELSHEECVATYQKSFE